jgi:CheY-like chemotaxis protein
MLAAARIGLTGSPGLRVSTAASGREGLALAVASKPDAILLDVVMPELDGPGTLRALGAQQATRDIPVVFLTASGDSDRARLVGLGAAGIIGKPFEPSQLGNLVSEALGWSR